MIRQLVRKPGFSLPVVAGLAFAIGSTTAVFSVFSAMLIRPIGVRDPARVAAVWRADEAHGQNSVELSYSDLTNFRTPGIDDLALASSVNLDFSLLTADLPDRIEGSTVTGNFFQVLGATPLVGRLLTAEDDRTGAHARAVLSARLWHTRFGGDPRVIGRELRVGSNSTTVVGIVRPEFDFPGGADIWIPLRTVWPDVEKSADSRVFRGVARLAGHATIAQVGTRLDAMARRGEPMSAQAAPGHRVRVTPILDEIYGPARPAVWMVLGAVAVVLLIACVNAANLLLHRATERRQEFAIRAALGARRGRLVQLLVGESALLAAVAGVPGLLLAAMGIRVLARMAPADVPRVAQATMDPLVLGFGIALVMATVLLFGVAPAFLTFRRDPQAALQEAGRGSTGTGHPLLRGILIAAEGALSAFLLAGGGMLVHSFLRMAAVDPGFRAGHVLTFRVTTELDSQESRRALYAAILERVHALPAVESAAAVLVRPLSGAVGWDTVYSVEGAAPGRPNENPNGNYEAISPEYFRTLGIAMVAGRDFTVSDTAAAPGVVIVDEATARRHWPAGEALGKRIRLGASQAPYLTVVGVVKPVRYRAWQAAWPDLYVPYMQRAQFRSDFVVKTAGNPADLVAAVRREVMAIDKNQPVSSVTTMEALVDSALSGSRFNGMVIAAVAGCALLLAAIGIYAVLSYTVMQRRAEIGVRMAMGASPRAVAALITREGMAPVLCGMVAGLAMAVWAQGLLNALLFGAGGLDVAAYGGAAVLLALVAALACAAPAWHAASIDPARTLSTR